MTGRMDPFQYETLEPGKDSRVIRIIDLLPGNPVDELKCNIRHVSLEDEPAYEAISYCWGPPTQEKVVCNGSSFLEVTLNLRSAFRRSRHALEPGSLWADAICINQANADKVSDQVRVMKQIYRNARRALIWLGDEDETTKEAHGLMWRMLYASRDKPKATEFLFGNLSEEGKKLFEPRVRKAPNLRDPSHHIFTRSLQRVGYSECG